MDAPTLAGFFDVKDLVDLVKNGGAGVTIALLGFAVYRLWERDKAATERENALHEKMREMAAQHQTERQADFQRHAGEVQSLLERNHAALLKAAQDERERERAATEAHQQELKARDETHRADLDRMMKMRIEEMEVFTKGVEALVGSAKRVQVKGGRP